jgi:hypothetical protein
VSGHSAQPVHPHCQNCGAAMHGPYCHQCGQHDFDFHRSFGHVFREALENFFHFDEKFFRNVVTLLFRPGQLSADFNAGRRAAQMPPFRLYLFISVLFFLMRLLQGTESEVPARSANDAEAAIPSAQPPVRIGGEEKKVRPPLERMLTERTAFAFRHQEEIKEAYVHAVPKMLLICLPVFALLTRLLFRRAGQLYLPHLIVSVHYHTFVFLWWLVSAGWSELTSLLSPALGAAVALAAGLWMILYPVVMLHRLYGQSWLKTSFKAVVLAIVYGLTITVGFTLTAIIVVAMV